MSEIVDKKEQVRTRKYGYSEIRELQSKLTLVAGDKQRDNRETIEVFDEVRLSYLHPSNYLLIKGVVK